MIRKFLRLGMAIILALSLIMAPYSFSAAKEDSLSVQNLATDQTNITDQVSEKASLYDEAIKQADVKAKFLTTLYGETSVQYALIDNGEIVISGQAGVFSKDNRIKPTKDSMYGIGSISKIYTTTAVMQLVDKGKVKLDNPVTKYIPEFKMKDSRYKSITVRMLLNHSSGLMGSTFSNTALFGDNDTVSCDNFLAILATQRLKADPGEFSVYCNDGFTLAQLLVERVSGISFTEYINKYISEPLDLNNTKTPLDDFQKDQLAKTYYITGNAALPADTINAIGAGGIYSTAEDMCHFAEIFMNNSDSSVLSGLSVKAMENKEYLNGLWYPEADSSLSFGLGWDSVNTYPFTDYGIKALVKGGDTVFYHSSLIVLPEEGMAMVVLSSGGASTYDQLFAQEVLLKVLLAKGSIEEIKAYKTFTSPVKSTMPSAQKNFAGFYALTGAVIKIDISNDGILSLYQSGTSPVTAQKYVYTGDGKFYYSDGRTYVSFKKESNGNTYLYASSYGSLPNIGETAVALYQGQRIFANPITKEVKASWDKRENKKYLLVNEKYSSQAYVISLPITQINMLTGLEGYIGNAAIVDANTAQTKLEIPGNYGRDLSDITFYNKDNTEYLQSSGAVFISEDAVKAISTKASFKILIGSDGYAKWYKLDKSKYKKIQVTLPENASFSVYDANGYCQFNSLISGQSTVTLPSGGYIVFAGSSGAKFTVKYVK